MVQRCLQLSLRLSARLRSLPASHPLQSFCKEATRTIACRRRADPGTSGAVGPAVDKSPTGKGGSLLSPADGRGWRGSGGGAATPLRLVVGAEEKGGGSGDGSAWRRYSDVVEEVVSLWCRDPETFDLDPLWLLPKLRAHKNW